MSKLNLLNDIQNIYVDAMVDVVDKLENANDIELLSLYKQLNGATDPFSKHFVNIIHVAITERMQSNPQKTVKQKVNEIPFTLKINSNFTPQQECFKTKPENIPTRNK